jgi:hypothetical protein
MLLAQTSFFGYYIGYYGITGVIPCPGEQHVGHGLQDEVEQSSFVQRIFLQTHGQEDDCWKDEDCQDGDHGHEQEEEDSAEESN